MADPTRIPSSSYRRAVLSRFMLAPCAVCFQLSVFNCLFSTAAAAARLSARPALPAPRRRDDNPIWSVFQTPHDAQAHVSSDRRGERASAGGGGRQQQQFTERWSRRAYPRADHITGPATPVPAPAIQPPEMQCMRVCVLAGTTKHTLTRCRGDAFTPMPRAAPGVRENRVGLLRHDDQT